MRSSKHYESSQSPLESKELLRALDRAQPSHRNPASFWLKVVLGMEEIKYPQFILDTVERLKEKLGEDEPEGILAAAAVAACIYDFDRNVIPSETRKEVVQWAAERVKDALVDCPPWLVIASSLLQHIAQQAVSQRIRIPPGSRERAIHLARQIAAGTL